MSGSPSTTTLTKNHTVPLPCITIIIYHKIADFFKNSLNFFKIQN
jgi:hypothetical protein